MAAIEEGFVSFNWPPRQRAGCRCRVLLAAARCETLGEDHSRRDGGHSLSAIAATGTATWSWASDASRLSSWELEPALLEGDGEGVRAAAGQSRQREHHLVERLAQHREETAGLSPSEAREAGQLVAEIADLKAELRADGLAEHEQDREERVMMKSIRLQEIRMKVHHDKQHVKQENKELGDDRQQLERLTNELETLKQELREEHGFSQFLMLFLLILFF
ncbi:unnamed protein product [Polarella glacialis]|uniref:Uncharacterized protein n=1 Tax=Polarella glacialis TaxID=89957 RepID=A0A813FHM5_POLGL|nr:unnamed protein product [Polarella glacialis]